MRKHSLGNYIKYEDYRKLEDEVKHLHEYTDHLVSFSKLPCLPKDLDNLRSANASLAVENARLKDELNNRINSSGKYIDEY
jgi:hypothetical protein